MIFSSSVFLFFFLPIVLTLNLILRFSRNLQNIALFVASILFYAYGEPIFVVLMLASIVVNWIFGLLVEKYRNKKAAEYSIMTVMLISNLSLFFIFKYLGFAQKCVNSIFSLNITISDIALPIGISFFTFQAISYVIDVYRQKGQAQKNPLNVGLYIAFFPQLIAGPIVRYETIAEQIKNRKETLNKFTYGTKRFIIGLSKKVIIANNMAFIADYIFEYQPEYLSCSLAWLGAVAYTFQIFFDFSGYSDMAIGIGNMFGFEFLENFNYPYISKSISEFWRRWHISLGTWFRDYVYFPLGGSRVSSKARLVFNLFVVWSLTGLWHGANVTFLLWGIMYFVLITIEKLTGFEKKLPKLNFLKHIYTLFFVVIGWVLFRTESVGLFSTFIKTMFGISSPLESDSSALFIFTEYLPIFAAAILCSLPLKEFFQNPKFNKLRPILEIGYYVIIAISAVISITFVVKGGYNPFIYFNF